MKKNLIYCAIAMVASVFTACNKESFKEPVQGEGRVFTASFADTKAASATGVVTFKAGETIDLWYMDGETAKSETITLTAENITNAGKSVVFNSTITADKIMAVYPGYVSGSTRGNNWKTATATASLPGAMGPRFNLTSATEGVSSGFVTGGSTSFTLKNQLAIISFSADETMSGFAYLYDNRYLADATAKNIYIQAIINWETGEAVGDNPQGYVATNKLTDKDDMRFVVVPTFSLPEGFTIKAGASLSTATEVVKTEKAFTANANQFLRIGNINRRALNIDIAAADITYNSAVLTFTPSDVEAEYIPMLTDKEFFDKFSSDEEIVADDIEFFELLATIYEMEFEEVLDVFVVSDVYSEEYEDLDPETAQVAYAYGFSKEKLIATSPVFTTEFTTLEKPGDPLPDDLVGKWICLSKTDYFGEETYTNWVMTISRAEDGSAKIENIDAAITAIAESIEVELDPVDAYWLGEDNTLVIPDKTATGLSAKGISVVWRGVEIGEELIFEDIEYVYDAEAHTLSLVNEAFGTQSDGNGFHTLFDSPLVFYKEGYEPDPGDVPEELLGEWVCPMAFDYWGQDVYTDWVMTLSANADGTIAMGNIDAGMTAIAEANKLNLRVPGGHWSATAKTITVPLGSPTGLSVSGSNLSWKGIDAESGDYCDIVYQYDAEAHTLSLAVEAFFACTDAPANYSGFKAPLVFYKSGYEPEAPDVPTTPEELAGNWICPLAQSAFTAATEYTDWTMSLSVRADGKVTIENFDVAMTAVCEKNSIDLVPSALAEWDGEASTLTIADKTATGLQTGSGAIVWRGISEGYYVTTGIVYNVDLTNHTLSLGVDAFQALIVGGTGAYSYFKAPLVFYKEGFVPASTKSVAPAAVKGDNVKKLDTKVSVANDAKATGKISASAKVEINEVNAKLSAVKASLPKAKSVRK